LQLAPSTNEATWILVALFAIAATGFLLEGLRIAATNDPWAAWSPFGNFMARLLRPALGTDAMQQAHRVTW
jgi:hypothetical protein